MVEVTEMVALRTVHIPEHHAQRSKGQLDSLDTQSILAYQ
ncbi:MAG: hypothetical protein ACI9FG_000967 [Crocinitomicaceae bacterium]|jgi:hypothetical protein